MPMVSVNGFLWMSHRQKNAPPGASGLFSSACTLNAVRAFIIVTKKSHESRVKWYAILQLNFLFKGAISSQTRRLDRSCCIVLLVTSGTCHLFSVWAEWSYRARPPLAQQAGDMWNHNLFQNSFSSFHGYCEETETPEVLQRLWVNTAASQGDGVRVYFVISSVFVRHKLIQPIHPVSLSRSIQSHRAAD